jgi:hypothetical protein
MLLDSVYGFSLLRLSLTSYAPSLCVWIFASSGSRLSLLDGRKGVLLVSDSSSRATPAPANPRTLRG